MVTYSRIRSILELLNIEVKREMKEYIIQELRNGLPASLVQYVDEIELLVMHDKYRGIS